MTKLPSLPSLVIALGLLSAAPIAPVAAQGFVSMGVGVGGGVGDRNKDDSGRGTHGAAYIQLHAPLFPIQLRFDALVAKTVDDKTAASLMTDAVFVAPLPIVQPYVLAGYGKYGLGRDGSQQGWNAGVGVRVRTPVVAFYGEARRHQRIGRDLLTIGISR